MSHAAARHAAQIRKAQSRDREIDPQESSHNAEGVGCRIHGINGELWGLVVKDAGTAWKLECGRIAKKATEGIKWRWASVEADGFFDGATIDERHLEDNRHTTEMIEHDSTHHEERSESSDDSPKLKRVSRKAKQKEFRKQQKVAKKVAASPGLDDQGTQVGDTRIGAGGTCTRRDESKRKSSFARAKEEFQLMTVRTDMVTLSIEDDEGQKRLPKSERKKQTELRKQLRRAESRAAEQAEADQIEASIGGILDARFRRRVLGCPAEIAPVPGCRHVWEIAPGYIPGMRAPARFFADEGLARLCLEEIGESGGGGFLPAVRQLANVSTLPGLMGCSLGMPDIHSGYGFAVGSVAAVDLTNPEAVVSPGGVGFDINCGVRLLRTSLRESDVAPHCAELASAIYKAVPSGVGADGAYVLKNEAELKQAIVRGMSWTLERGLCWPEDLECTEEGGVMPDADASAVSSRAIKRGSPQLGTLGSGNHYLEIQVVDEVFDEKAADAMGLAKGGVCVMIHCGSRGLGHQLCTDYLVTMEAAMKKQGISVPDRQLCCVRASSQEGQQYLRGMAAAANYAFVNRTLIAHAVRETFGKVLGRDPRKDLQMHMVYDVAHNIAKREEHIDPADGVSKATLVHRKGATRSFPPGHDALPEIYKSIGQPVLIGGSMGTCSYVLAGNDKAMSLSFGSTCHGAGRKLSRAAALRQLCGPAVLAKLRAQGIEVRVASPKLVAEEADESYKDVSAVVRTCHEVGISRLVARMRPLAVIKG
eukprot:TRINITY_DN63114_c0_g1_i1.p1 TRINITY_DN63114_c0_g1~~TRINITY_DN63114_c0_g1_i1.p1  ORF type:complete len:833 (-),score=94.21 TRINITY_DN63114_c0_g1_i1:453-2738(-)